MKLLILDINNMEYLYNNLEIEDYSDFSDILKLYKLIKVERIYDNKEMLLVTDKVKCVYEKEVEIE